MTSIALNGTSQYLTVATTPVNALPLTIAAWFLPDTDGATQGGPCIAHVGDTAGDLNFCGLFLSSSNPVRAACRMGSGTTFGVNSTANPTVGAWNHGVAVHTSDVSRTSYLNGANSASAVDDAGTFTANYDTFTIGALRRSTVASYFDGVIGPVAVWNVALTADEAAMLGQERVDPRYVRPHALVAYVPWPGRDASAIDIIGARLLALTGSPTASAEAPPMLWMPGRRTISLAGGVVPPTGQQLVVLTSIGALSHLNGSDADVGGTEFIDLLTDLGNPVAIDAAGVVTITGGGLARQVMNRRFRYANGTYDAVGVLVVNDHAPVPNTQPPIFLDQVLTYQKSVAISAYDFDALVTDPDGDAITMSAQTALPTGLSFSSADLVGTPTTYQSISSTIRWAGLYGGYYEEVVEFLIGEAAPNVAEETEANAITTIEALASFTIAQPSPTATHPTIPLGSVISQVPAAGEIVASNQEFTLTVSSGPVVGGGALSMINDFGFRI